MIITKLFLFVVVMLVLSLIFSWAFPALVFISPWFGTEWAPVISGAVIAFFASLAV